QAQLLADMSEVARCPSSTADSPVVRIDDAEVLEFSADEIGAALSLTRRAADSDLGLALEIRERLPMVWEALAAGHIDLRKARTITTGTGHLPEEDARRVVERVIGQAGRLTTGQLAARIARLCVEADPESARTRYQEALEERRVVSESNPDGTADLTGMQLPPQRVGAIAKYLNKIAGSLKTAGDHRSIDQLRADIYLDLLEGRHLGERNGKGMVDIVVDLQTLIGLSDIPAEIPGMGPVIADIARQVVAEQADAEWRYTVTDENGQVAYTGITQRRPTVAQHRHVQARNPTCVFPGCRMPSRNCDIDHTVAVIDGGPTTTCNLAPLCRHHHRTKHEAPWQLTRHHHSGHRWISRLGHSYTTSGRSP
ncbi:MAG: DUF222 domain-containing protein, partial [Actinobacteria bacterium]|nr:DUF222 domain-containing protein [Actinomycetota bacterium]